MSYGTYLTVMAQVAYTALMPHREYSPGYLVVSPAQLGQVLRGFRKSRGLTQSEAGGRVGLRQEAISHFENDPGPSSVERLFRILAALDVELVLRDRDGESE